MANMKVAKEVAEKEVAGWLDHKKVSDKKRESLEDNIEVLVDAVCDGLLKINTTDFTITQVLKFPVEGEKGAVALGELVFKPRVKIEAVRVQMASVKVGDTFGMVLAYMAALTGQPRGVLKEMVTDDTNVSQAIVTFFF